MILDPKVTPNVVLRQIKRDSITADVKSATVEFCYDSENDRFTESMGATKVRFGPKRAHKKEYPADMWRSEIEKYLNWGYRFVTDQITKVHSLVVDGVYKPLKDKFQEAFIKAAVEANDETMKASFTMSIEEIPKDCIDKANEIMISMQQELADKTLDIASFNAYLTEFFTALPIAISKADNYFASYDDYEHYTDVISRLQEKLDAMIQQLRKLSTFKAKADERPTIIEANNLEMRNVTKDEKQKILEYMSDQKNNYVRAWKVTNRDTEKRFEEYCKSEGLTDENGISHLWHGTGFGNMWSIMKSGLYLNPALIKANVPICGKMFGYGLYFAPYCRKSMNYTSASSAMYHGESGGQKGGFMFIFKVATGNPYWIAREGGSRPNHWNDFHEDHPNKHCLWAERGQNGSVGRLCFDEVVVYQECQATVEYIVEFSDITK